MSVGRGGRLVCDHCDLEIRGEHVTLSHGFVGHPNRPALDFCSSECLADHLYDEVHADRTHKEVESLRAMLCPACWTKTA